MIDLYGLQEIKEEERKKKDFGFLFLKIFYEKAASKPDKSMCSFEVRLESTLEIAVMITLEHVILMIA